jgi:hypothetical protein
MFFFFCENSIQSWSTNTAKHLVHADDLSIWAETNKANKNAQASIAAIQVAGMEIEGNTKTMSVCQQNEGYNDQTLLLNPLKIWQFSNILKRHWEMKIASTYKFSAH